VDPEGKLDPSLLGEKGTNCGVMPISSALKIAQSLKLDLVEVSPNADPPVVKILDYGKLIFDQKKSTKKQKVQKLKVIQLRPGTGDADYQVKVRKLIAFLDNGDKVKVTIRFRGREITHPELGSRLLERIKKDVADSGIIDQEPKLEGRQMVMLISPKK